MEIDLAYERAREILLTASDRIGKIHSEEDAKLQLITRVVTEVLGWSFSEIAAESPNSNGFSDYLISDGNKASLVIEAKRVGALGLDTKTKVYGFYKLSGPVLKPARSGIDQVASYCQPLGIPLAVLTDGLTWVIFLPWVPNSSFLERQAIVFPTFEAVLESFTIFYELLAKDHIRRGTYRVAFDAIHENRLVLERELISPVWPTENTIIQKSGLAFDLDVVFESFFSNLTGDDDPDMLMDCFVESRESRVADFSLERLTKNVLGNIDLSGRDVGQGLRDVVEAAVTRDRGETVFIVGPSGAGKTTFIKRFFERTLAPEIRDRCVPIRVDVLHASGDEQVALPWLTEQAIGAIEAQLFEDGMPAWSDLQALYHLEYLRRAKGTHAGLYERDKAKFKEEFEAYVDGQVERDRESYLRRLLADIVKNRKRLPVFIVDNSDEFGIAFKTVVFQYFQALRQSAGQCLLIFPVTDRSAWSFSKTDIFNIYSSRSFFLPTPSPREVFRKRIDYIRDKTDGASSGKSGAEYMMSRGIRVSIPDLAAFASVMESVFVEQDYAARRVGELSNYNMRKALGLAKRVITSSVFNLEDLVRSYITGKIVAPTNAQFSNALIKGDYRFYKAGDEPLLYPLYQVDSKVRQSPLLNARILVMLNGLTRNAGEDSDRYIQIQSIVAYFGVMSIPEVATERAVESLLAAGLLDSYDASEKEFSDSLRVAISYSGQAHLDLAVYNPIFFEQYALTARIPDPEVASEIRSAFMATGQIALRLEQVRELFARYLIDEDNRLCVIPDRAEFLTQAELVGELRSRWVAAAGGSEAMWQPPEMVAARATGSVENFDHPRGFGFVYVATLREDAFLHARILEQDNIQEVYDGDEVICDITRGEKGYVVSKVHEVVAVASQTMAAKVVKLVPDKRFGFMSAGQNGGDAFFHYNLFSPDAQKQLEQGQEYLIETKTDHQGRFQVRRIISGC